MPAAALPYSDILNSLISGIQAPRMPTMGRNPIANAFTQAQNQANQANASRGQNILRLLAEQGQTQMDDNNRMYNEQLGTIDQNLMSRGLTNTTVRDNLQEGALNDLSYANQRTREGAAGAIASAAERFTQAGPNLSMMASLLSQGGGGGGGGGIVDGPRPFEFAPVGWLKNLPYP